MDEKTDEQTEGWQKIIRLLGSEIGNEALDQMDRDIEELRHPSCDRCAALEAENEELKRKLKVPCKCCTEKEMAEFHSAEAVLERVEGWWREAMSKRDNARERVAVLEMHKGDPCIYCGVPGDMIYEGPCQGTREALMLEIGVLQECTDESKERGHDTD